MSGSKGVPIASPFSPEGSAQALNGSLRAHLISCPACRTGECEEGDRMRRALRAVRTVLKEPEPPTPLRKEARC
ncbi:hypothetical protein [Streptomyces atriruber]|uniref:hypothetical protein n=1 Tax=Streptomyces atriruber TaxID=545121 RepID=UPI0006E2D0ED|nr:hypothetical protein [Streptomyces atriruber]